MTTTRDRLARIPDLAAECFVTWGAPNPSGWTGRTSRVTGSREPTDLATLDALRIDGHGLLARLTECVRLVWQSMAADQRPALTNPPTWTSEAGWLLGSWDWALASLDLADIDWLSDEIRSVHGALARVAREAPPLVLRCTRSVVGQACGGRLVGRDAGNADTTDWARSRWAYCPDCGQTYTYDAALRSLGSVKRWTLDECAAELGVPYGTARRWKHEGLVHATGKDHRGRSVFDLEQVRRVKDRAV